jgi:hypothetical protein
MLPWPLYFVWFMDVQLKRFSRAWFGFVPLSVIVFAWAEDRFWGRSLIRTDGVCGVGRFGL